MAPIHTAECLRVAELRSGTIYIWTFAGDANLTGTAHIHQQERSAQLSLPQIVTVTHCFEEGAVVPVESGLQSATCKFEFD